MRTFLITFDLASKTPHSLASTIMQLGEAWARPLENTWYVQTAARAGVLEQQLKPHLDTEDGLLIQPVEANAVLLNTVLRWFKRRCPEHAREGADVIPNVVAFPVRSPAEAMAARDVAADAARDAA
jgi:hypothetical protein